MGGEFADGGDGPVSEGGYDIAKILVQTDLQVAAGLHDGDDDSQLGSGVLQNVGKQWDR